MNNLCIRFICLAVAGLFLPLTGYSADPILLQGKINEPKPEPSWYNSSDPEVLNNQIQLLNQTIVETRRVAKDREKELKQVTRELEKARKEIESLEKKLKRSKQGEVIHVTDPQLELDLNQANASIASLESQLADTQQKLTDALNNPKTIIKEVPAPAQAAPLLVASPVDESKELAEMKALVRTYEKAIASLEDELDSFRELPEAAPQVDPTPVPQPMPPVIVDEIEESSVELEKPSVSQPVEETKDSLSMELSELDIPNMEPIVEMAPPAVLESVEPTPSEANLLLDAEQALDSGDLNRADALYREALIYNPDLIKAELGLASIAYARNELDSASQQIEAILKKFPDQADALGLKGIIHWRAGRSQAAKEHLAKAIELDGNNARLMNFMAIVLDAGGDSDGALAILERAVKVNPDFPEAHFNLAVIEMMRPLPDREKATMHYEQSILLGSQRDTRLEDRLYADR